MDVSTNPIFSSVRSGPQKIKLKIVKSLLISVLTSFPVSLLFFFLSFFFATMFALPNGNFRKLKTLQHILGLRTCSFVSS
jgi:hypothetical protein